MTWRNGSKEGQRERKEMSGEKKRCQVKRRDVR
jgi:hypothetical protein